MNLVLPRHGEHRGARDRRITRRRSGNDRRAEDQPVQFNPVAVGHSSDERRMSDRRKGMGRRIVGDRRAT